MQVTKGSGKTCTVRYRRKVRNNKVTYKFDILTGRAAKRAKHFHGDGAGNHETENKITVQERGLPLQQRGTLLENKDIS